MIVVTSTEYELTLHIQDNHYNLENTLTSSQQYGQ